MSTFYFDPCGCAHQQQLVAHRHRHHNLQWYNKPLHQHHPSIASIPPVLGRYTLRERTHLNTPSERLGCLCRMTADLTVDLPVRNHLSAARGFRFHLFQQFRPSKRNKPRHKQDRILQPTPRGQSPHNRLLAQYEPATTSHAGNICHAEKPPT